MMRIQLYRKVGTGWGKNGKRELIPDVFALVDDADYIRLKDYIWLFNKSDQTGHFYAVRSDGNNKIYMHRDIMGLGSGKALEVDHIDGDGLNNQKSNLRSVSRIQNLCNSRKRCTGGTSKFKGVSLHEGKWRVQLRKNGKYITLGRYGIEVEAGYVSRLASKILFGEFARLDDIPLGNLSESRMRELGEIVDRRLGISK